MLVNVVFDEEEHVFDIINVPSFVANDIENVQQMFFSWLYDEESNNHNYWKFTNGLKSCAYGTEEFVDWINNVHLVNETGEKAKIIKKFPNKLDNNIPTIYF